MANKTFPSKLLLTGEHAVLMGSSFLAMPFTQYSGRWGKGDKKDDSLTNFLFYLIENCSEIIDTQQLSKNIEDGYSFASDIPYGYGLGSSGALSAAVYYRYAIHPKNEVFTLKKELAVIESFFHGKSSGIDPLVSHTNAIIYSYGSDICKIDKVEMKYTSGGFFLMDSGRKRNSKKHVDQFRLCLKNKSFKEMIKKSLIPQNKVLSEGIINHDKRNIKLSFKKISILQRDHFKSMIPDDMMDIWIKGLESEEYYLKLCGAGGGGYFLGWSNVEIEELQISDYKIITL